MVGGGGAPAVHRLPTPTRCRVSSVGYAAAEQRGRAVIDGVSRARSVDDLDPEATRLLGTAAIVTGAWDLAPALLAASARGLRRQGRLGQSQRVLAVQAMVAVRRTDWAVALPASEEARRLASETRQVIWVAGADAVASLAAALRGEEDLTERLAQLFLSHRTVGSHLYRIFPKLGITSRSQLRSVIDGRTA
jgi:hypothetical protein